MGIKGLQWFIEQLHSACYEVYIPDLAENYRKEYMREPILVVDAMSVHGFLYRPLGWIHGGQYAEYKNVLENFVKKFESCGIRLVFFFDGPTMERKRPVWLKRRNEDKKKVAELFESLKAGKTAEQLEQNDFKMQPSGLSWLTAQTFKEAGCQVYLASRECDEEVAQYAEDHECFGILGQDTDFIIYKGGKYCLSMKNFNLETMTTKNYDRTRLARYLNLWPQQLPLFATLVGNDIVPSEDLKVFHLSLSVRRHPHWKVNDARVKFRLVSDFIQKNNKAVDDLHWVAMVAFSDPSKAALIKESIESYNPHNTNSVVPKGEGAWGQLMELAARFHRECWIPASVYTVIVLGYFQAGGCIENYSEPTFPFSGKLFLPLRQRLYGILLYEKPLNKGEEFHMVKEWVLGMEETLTKESWVSALLPTKPHPGLRGLWSEKEREKSWGLFLEALGLEPLPASIPRTLFLFTLTIAYLYKLPVRLEEWEWDVTIEASLLANGLDSTKSIVERPPLDPRGLNIFSLVTRLFSFISLLNSACGYPIDNKDAMIHLCFNGRLFHKKYNKWKQTAPNQRTPGCQVSLSLFQEIQSYVKKIKGQCD